LKSGYNLSHRESYHPRDDDTLIAYIDGASECRDASDNEPGIPRVANHRLPEQAHTALDTIVADIAAFRSGPADSFVAVGATDSRSKTT
jgi:hypothetical protein